LDYIEEKFSCVGIGEDKVRLGKEAAPSQVENHRSIGNHGFFSA
jgi:hypothetical protein